VVILVVLGVSFSAGTTFPGGVAALPADRQNRGSIRPETRRHTAASTPRGLKPLSSEYYGKTAKSHKADPEYGGPIPDEDDHAELETSRDDKSNGAGYYSTKSSKSVGGQGKGAGYYSAKSSKSVDGQGKKGAFYSAKSSKSVDGKGKGADVDEDEDFSMDVVGKGKGGYDSKKSKSKSDKKSANGKGKGYDSKKSKSDKKSGYGKGKGKGGDYRVIVTDSENLEDAVTDGEVIAADKNATKDDTSEDDKSPLASLLDSFKDTDTDIEASEDSSKDDSKDDSNITLPAKKNTTAVNETEDVTSNDMSSEDEKTMLICGTDQDCIDGLTASSPSFTSKSTVSLLVAVATVVTIAIS